MLKASGQIALLRERGDNFRTGDHEAIDPARDGGPEGDQHDEEANPPRLIEDRRGDGPGILIRSLRPKGEGGNEVERSVDDPSDKEREDDEKSRLIALEIELMIR